MHCASCVLTIEKALKRLEGVQSAAVNIANEKATVEYDPSKITDKELSSAVANAGYKALIDEEVQTEDEEKKQKQKELSALKTKVTWSLIFGGAIFWGSFPGIMETAPWVLKNFWIQLLLATPVQFWAGWEFYRGTTVSLRHRTANMDTLVAIGTTVAYGYSAFVTAFPGFVERIGIDILKGIIVEDSLGICVSLEARMQEAVEAYKDPWAEADAPAYKNQFEGPRVVEGSKVVLRMEG